MLPNGNGRGGGGCLGAAFGKRSPAEGRRESSPAGLGLLWRELANSWPDFLDTGIRCCNNQRSGCGPFSALKVRLGYGPTMYGSIANATSLAVGLVGNAGFWNGRLYRKFRIIEHGTSSVDSGQFFACTKHAKYGNCCFESGSFYPGRHVGTRSARRCSDGTNDRHTGRCGTGSCSRSCTGWIRLWASWVPYDWA